MEAFALESHTRALKAMEEGRFNREVVPMNGVEMDETARHTSMEKMATLEPLVEGGSITAAVSSQTCDGASAMLLVSEDALKRYNLTPRARIHHMSVRAEDPIWMLTAPIPATAYAMKRSGMKLQDIDLVEINEAFASVPMAWLLETGYPHEKNQCEWRRHRPGASPGCHWHQIDDHTAARAGAQRWQIRSADHV